VALAVGAGGGDPPRLLQDPPPYRPNAVLRGPEHLPVGFAEIGA
jgi:hypothetical protein